MSTNDIIVCLPQSQSILTAGLTFMYSDCTSNFSVVVTGLSKHLGAPRMSNQKSNCADVCLDWRCCHHILEPSTGFNQESTLTYIISIKHLPSNNGLPSNKNPLLGSIDDNYNGESLLSADVCPGFLVGRQISKTLNAINCQVSVQDKDEFIGKVSSLLQPSNFDVKSGSILSSRN